MDQLNKKVVLNATAAAIAAAAILAGSKMVFGVADESALCAVLMIMALAAPMLLGSLPWHRGVTPSFLAFLSATAAATGLVAGAFDSTGDLAFFTAMFVGCLVVALSAILSDLDEHVPPMNLVLVYAAEMACVFFAAKLIL